MCKASTADSYCHSLNLIADFSLQIVASWEEAESNGSPVTSYKLEIYELPENNIIGSLDVEPDVFSHSFTDLKCETTYR